jgi:CheY-specific phosphatase CheX
MLDEVMGEALQQATINVLEEAAFVMPLASQAKPFRGEVLRAQLRFQGPMSGTLMMATTSAAAARLAANILGVDKVERDAVPDAVGELLNMLAGCVLSEWFGATENCTLGLPSTKLVSVPEHEEALAKASLRVTLTTEEDERVDVAALIEGA